ncbi:Rid family hydrolase [Achromobacter xylosoxidans]
MRANGFVFVSGQLGFLPPVQPGEPPRLAQGVAAQTEAALRSLAAILQAAGTSMSAVVNVTVYIPDVGMWNEVNGVYERSFGDHPRSRHRADTGIALWGAGGNQRRRGRAAGLGGRRRG